MRTRTWKAFARNIRPHQKNLLCELPKYPNSILISGCQRSGGTMLAQTFTEHADIIDFAWSKDSELDAALLLSGARRLTSPQLSGKRFCFQTTYLNERVQEYEENSGNFHLIWLIRNPYSVVYSMLHNWKRFALNEVFLACGSHLTTEIEDSRLSRFGIFGIGATKRACYAYLGKLAQCEKLLEKLPADKMVTVEYEDLVTNKEFIMRKLQEFVRLEPETLGGCEISTRSLNKSDRLSVADRQTIGELCEERYEEFILQNIRIHAKN